MNANEETYATITSYLVVPDADAEIRFLAAAFDAQEVLCHRNDDGTVMHAELRLGDSLLMLGQAGGACFPRTAAHYLWLADVDESYRRALAAGASSESVPEDKAYGHRCAGVIDSNGLTWWLASPVRSRDGSAG